MGEGAKVDVTDLDAEGILDVQDLLGRYADELRKTGLRLRDLDVRLELGLQESVRSAVQAGFGVSFISRTAVESELAAGTLAQARVEGIDATREISLARGTGRAATRVAEAFLEFARERLG